MNKLINICLTVVMALFLFSCSDDEETSSGYSCKPFVDDGSYIAVNNWEDFNAIPANAGGAKYCLMNDLVIPGEAWVSKDFKNGTFDGNNKVISGTMHLADLAGCNEAAYGYGLFAEIDSATVENLRLEDISLNGGSITDFMCSAGTLAGAAKNSTIKNVHVRNTNVPAFVSQFLGGIVGFASDANIIDSSVVDSIIGTGKGTGGLTGNATRGTIATSYAKNNNANYAFVNMCYGGLSGNVNGATIRDSWAENLNLIKIDGVDEFGGLVCKLDGSVTINNSWVISSISDSYQGQNYGGVIGNLNGKGATINNVYYNTNNENIYTTGTIFKSVGEMQCMTTENCSVVFEGFDFIGTAEGAAPIWFVDETKSSGKPNLTSNPVE